MVFYVIVVTFFLMIFFYEQVNMSARYIKDFCSVNMHVW